MLNWKTLKKLGDAVLFSHVLGSFKTQDQIKIRLDSTKELFKRYVGRVYEDTLPSVSEVEAKEGDMCILIVDDEFTPYEVVGGVWKKYSNGSSSSGGGSVDLTDYYTKNEVNTKLTNLDSKYVQVNDTTLVKLNNENEINLQEDHYNAWFGYRDGKVTNWKFGDGTEGGLGNVYAKDFYLNGQKLSDLLDEITEDSDLTAHTSNANIHVTISDKNKWNDTYTKVEVDNKISGLVNSAPETLNTLNALAEALGNDENFAVNVATQIGLKANTSDLSTVATSGSYDDLDGKPTIPTKTSELINDSNFLTGEQDIGNLTDHISNTDIHVTTADKAKWNGKQDALSEEQLNNIDDVVNKVNDNEVIHKSGNETAEGVKTFSDGIVTTLLNNKTPETIEEQGDGYIRYSNGIQMCWGGISIENSNGSPSSFHITFAKSFNENIPFVTMSFVGSNSRETLGGIEGVVTSGCGGFYSSYSNKQIHYYAIGRWK